MSSAVADADTLVFHAGLAPICELADRTGPDGVMGERSLTSHLAGASSGSSTLKVAPRPASLSTAIRPPWLSVIALAIESPSPVPGAACSPAEEDR